jgi:hypothetical protein
MEPQQLDPQLVAAITEAAMKIIGALGGTGVMTLIVGYFGKQWLDQRQRENGGDSEHAAKVETREQIKAQGVALASVSGSLEVTAKIQERMLVQLDEMRREAREAHARIEAEIRRA